MNPFLAGQPLEQVKDRLPLFKVCLGFGENYAVSGDELHLVRVQPVHMLEDSVAADGKGTGEGLGYVGLLRLYGLRLLGLRRRGGLGLGGRGCRGCGDRLLGRFRRGAGLTADEFGVEETGGRDVPPVAWEEGGRSERLVLSEESEEEVLAEEAEEVTCQP